MSLVLMIVGAVIKRQGVRFSSGKPFFSWGGLADCICIASGLTLISYGARL